MFTTFSSKAGVKTWVTKLLDAGRLETLVRSLGIQAPNWNVGSNPSDATS